MIIQRLKILANLTDLNKNIFIALLFTVVGIYVADGWLGVRALVLFLANWFSIVFLYIINNIHAADKDALSVDKRVENPIALGLISKSESYLILFVFGSFTFSLYLMLAVYIENYFLIINSFVILLTAYFYSSKPLCLRRIPIIDVVVRVYILGLGQYIATLLSFPLVIEMAVLLIYGFILFLSSIALELENEISNYDSNREVGVKCTSSIFKSKRKLKNFHRLYLFATYIISALLIALSLKILNIEPDVVLQQGQKIVVVYLVSLFSNILAYALFMILIRKHTYKQLVNKDKIMTYINLILTIPLSATLFILLFK